MKTKITKIKTKDGTAQVEYLKTNPEDGKQTEVGEKLPYLYTESFKDAIDALKPHLVKICDLREGDMIGDDIEDHGHEALSNIKVTGISISGSDESEGVTIIGQKEIGNKVLNLISPFTRFTDEHDPYDHEHQLYEAVVHLCYEAELYVFEGKHAVKQLELFGEDAEDLD